MKKGLLIGLGVLGALALLGSSSKAAVSPIPTPPPPQPPKPKTKPPGVQVDIGPATITPDVVVPEGWIASPPGTLPADTLAQMRTLGGAPGTKYPFQMNGKNYLGLVLGDGSLAILEEG